MVPNVRTSRPCITAGQMLGKSNVWFKGTRTPIWDWRRGLGLFPEMFEIRYKLNCRSTPRKLLEIYLAEPSHQSAAILVPKAPLGSNWKSLWSPTPLKLRIDDLRKHLSLTLILNHLLCNYFRLAYVSDNTMGRMIYRQLQHLLVILSNASLNYQAIIGSGTAETPLLQF